MICFSLIDLLSGGLFRYETSLDHAITYARHSGVIDEQGNLNNESHTVIVNVDVVASGPFLQVDSPQVCPVLCGVLSSPFGSTHIHNYVVNLLM